MNISKINAYTQTAKSYQVKPKTTSFKGIESPMKCFDMTSCEYFKKYGGFRTIITYNEILSLKAMADKNMKKAGDSNLAIAFVGDKALDGIFATPQTDLWKRTAQWTDITDYDSF